MLYLTPAYTAYIIILTAVLGMVMGSFTNCMAWRIAHGEDFVHGRSHCAVCGHQLSAKDLIPVLSWFLMKGKCRYCGEKISIRYPITEILSGIAFAAILLRYGLSYDTLQFFVLTIILLAVALVDLDISIIPDSFIIAGILNRLLFASISGIATGNVFKNAITSIANGLIIAVPLFILVVIMDRVLKKESMGGGDIKLFFMTAMYFNWKCNLFAILLSCILGIIFTVVFNNIKTGDDENPTAFPFGPSISAAAFISILAAQQIIDLYLSLF
ncbi:Type 4 prepilin-like proteins leader peptide-processing enzyme [bioreactor metagenome]|uniref:Type 4 prepilin-like proteins leader peptide-processing enzyme n=1 Tax=bioreactor metagenome TaxID=1076179 RepID=A0A645B988_9ZZZZ|nr:prepilin peptidase [Candidatus Metalachnospira sp.]